MQASQSLLDMQDVGSVISTPICAFMCHGVLYVEN